MVRRGGRKWFVPITLIFSYSTIVDIIERPEGIQIASLFIVSIIGASVACQRLSTNWWRSDPQEATRST